MRNLTTTIKASALLKAGMISLIFCAAGFSNQAGSADISTAGQLCQPANLQQALLGISWQSRGIYNDSASELWVICPIPTFWEDNDTCVYIAGKALGDTKFSCTMKLTDRKGDVVSAETKETSIGGAYFATNFYVGGITFDQNMTVSFKLKPGMGISTVRVDSDPPA